MANYANYKLDSAQPAMSNSSRLLCHPFRNEAEPIVVCRFALFIVVHKTKHFKLFVALIRSLWRS